MNCINLTKKMNNCKSRPAHVNVRNDGLVTAHCRRHWFDFYGRFGALPMNVYAVFKYNDTRAKAITSTFGVNRLALAMAFADNDLNALVSGHHGER